MTAPQAPQQPLGPLPGEQHVLPAELTSPITITAPRMQTAPVVFSSPHSGRIYPAAFLASSRLSARALRKSEDCYVDELLTGLQVFGAPVLAAQFPRAYLDVNREPYELDPSLFRDRLPDYANSQSVRVAGGLGTIARIVAEGEEIYRERLTVAEGLARIEQLYKPFHATLTRLLETTRARFGHSILIDCHSMPSTSAGSANAHRPDIVLGDRFGSSCDAALTRLVQECFAARGLQVALNRPYAGGFITEHYGRPSLGCQALQIEINRGLYMHEDTLERRSDFETFRAGFGAVMEDVIASLPAEPRRQAAE
jgi:N-formylglutamate amidohydrolase